MKILFSNPPWWERDPASPAKILAGVRAGARVPALKAWPPPESPAGQFDFVPYPFLMCSAAAYVAKWGGNEAVVRVRDSIALRESPEAYLAFLQHESPDFLVIETSGPSWDHDQKLIRQIHTTVPSAKIIVCGPIVPRYGSQIIARLPVLACIQGEYEKNMVQVLEGRRGVLPFNLLTESEMNLAPAPYYDDMVARRYSDLTSPAMPKPQAQLWSSRGCPYRCGFCVMPATMTGADPSGFGERRVRRYSAEYIADHLRRLVTRFQFASVNFDDDTFNLGSDHVESICRVMYDLRLPWTASCRPDTIPLSTWRLMRDCGCMGVRLGIETGSQRVLNQIAGKGLDLERTRQLLFELRRLDLWIHATLIVGLPGETANQRDDTIKYIKSLPIESAEVNAYSPIEGSPLNHPINSARVKERSYGTHVSRVSSCEQPRAAANAVDDPTVVAA